MDITPDVKRLGRESCAYLDGPMFFLVHMPGEKTGAVLDSVSLEIMTIADQAEPGSGLLVGEYWLHGLFDMDLEWMP